MKVLFAGGGTGGHINPAISVANYMKSKDPDFQALFIGTKRGLEKRLVPAAGYELKYINIEGFNRKNMLKNVKVLKELHDAKKKCVQLIHEFKPDYIVCTGGYVSGPVTMAAKKCNVPALIHEQNVYPGLTVKGSGKYVDCVAVSFEETINHIAEREKCEVTGNPVRPEILAADPKAARRAVCVNDKPFVLIFGGSLGAERINRTVLDILPKLIEEGNVQILFGTGDRNYEKIKQEIEERGIQLPADIRVVPYIDNMHEAMAAADIVVSRSGAITVSEIAALGKASILIPSPNVVRNHQEQNAREFEKKGGAAVLIEAELTPDSLYQKLMEMISDREGLARMGENAKKLAQPDALEKLYRIIEKAVRK